MITLRRVELLVGRIVFLLRILPVTRTLESHLTLVPSSVLRAPSSLENRLVIVESSLVVAWLPHLVVFMGEPGEDRVLRDW